ncbi:hypothetical protein [Mucilaginibacter jinjuensis]|uniref:Uncharacterized protein n=1 Tax=Mucilaginibacter jinjuensis TaxID=1176721 RepID=A0ABY7TBX6_9SPHI|nr:hypothetical protein [Mucilaginibacter jinjuensis]WCT13744.1 hypothetical protein PQO05_07325 [Mucilaginibacter jinjuensis]
MSNILLNLGIRPIVLNYFLPYLGILTENSAVFPYYTGDDVQDHEIFQKGKYSIPNCQAIWTAYPISSPAVRQHFLFYSALESLCYFSLHTEWMSCSDSIGVSAVGLSPEPSQIVRLCATFPNAKLHLGFGNDLTGQVMDCQVPLWLKRKYWQFSYHKGLLYINSGQRTFSIAAEKFSCKTLLGTGSTRHFKKEKPRGGFTSFYEQLRYGN